jgi:tRNA 2-thiocytidine biosynthesis protein TtcA
MVMAVPLQWVGSQGNTKIQKLEKKLLHYTGKAIGDYRMIQKGDRVLVCVSGGKDSITLLLLLNLLRLRSPQKFEIQAFTLDQSQPGWNDAKFREFMDLQRIPYKILTEDTYSIVKEKVPEGKTYCSLCSRLRRGIIYRYARENGFNKVALGHHREDLIHSLLMSIFYNGEIRTMPPKLLTDEQDQILIRPLVYCQEKDIAEYAMLREFPIIPCNLCGSQENLARKKVAKLVRALAEDNPKIPSNMLRAISQVRPSQLMDKKLWDFDHLEEKMKDVEN